MFNQKNPEGVRAFIYEYLPDFPEPYDKAEKEIYIPSVKVIVNAEDVFFSAHPRNTCQVGSIAGHEPHINVSPLREICLTTEYVDHLVNVAAAKEFYMKASADFHGQLKNLQKHSAFHHEQFHTNHFVSITP